MPEIDAKSKITGVVSTSTDRAMGRAVWTASAEAVVRVKVERLWMRCNDETHERVGEHMPCNSQGIAGPLLPCLPVLATHVQSDLRPLASSTGELWNLSEVCKDVAMCGRSLESSS